MSLHWDLCLNRRLDILNAFSRFLARYPDDVYFQSDDAFFVRYDSVIGHFEPYNVDSRAAVTPPYSPNGVGTYIPVAAGCFQRIHAGRHKKAVIYRYPADSELVACDFPGCDSPDYDLNTDTIVQCIACALWYHAGHFDPYDPDAHSEAHDTRIFVPSNGHAFTGFHVPRITRSPRSQNSRPMFVHLARGLSLDVSPPIKTHERLVSALLDLEDDVREGALVTLIRCWGNRVMQPVEDDQGPALTQDHAVGAMLHFANRQGRRTRRDVCLYCPRCKRLL